MGLLPPQTPSLALRAGMSHEVQGDQHQVDDLAALGLERVIAFTAQQLDERATDCGVVVGDEYALPGDWAVACYPAFLAFWGWRDLWAQGGNTMTARIVDLRSSKQARTPQPGITSRVFRTSYTVALEPIDASISQEVVTFSIKEEMYLPLHQGTVVQITYSPNLHYVYALKQVDEGRK